MVAHVAAAMITCQPRARAVPLNLKTPSDSLGQQDSTTAAESDSASFCPRTVECHQQAMSANVNIATDAATAATST